MQRIFEDARRDPAPFPPNPPRALGAKYKKGRGTFSAGWRCEKLEMGGITALSAPDPPGPLEKKWLPPKP